MKLEVKFRFICHQISFALQKFDSAKILLRSADKIWRILKKLGYKKDAKNRASFGPNMKRTSVAEVRMFSQSSAEGLIEGGGSLGIWLNVCVFELKN